MRKAMVEENHPQLSVRTQCELLGINRNRLAAKPRAKWEPKPEHYEMMELMRLAHRKDPTMGARQLRRVLRRNCYEVTRWTVCRMMRFLGLKAIYCRPRTSVPCPEHPKYPYLLRQREISKPDEVWAVDITYIPWSKGYVYLIAILDWHTRAVLGWRLSNTMDVSFCLEALCEALAVAGRAPEILNSDQGSQFTSVEWLSAVESLGSQVSMDGKGRWQDNVLIERLWRSVKHEWVLLHEYNTLPELEALLGQWIDRYNRWRPHTANDGQTPWEAYRGEPPVLERDQLRGEGASEIGWLPASPASSQPISQHAA
jgi:putative transposase